MSSTIDISLGAPCGAIRAIHGINNSPSIVEAAALPAEKEAFRALRIPRVRHHDAPIENSRYELVDVSRQLARDAIDAGRSTWLAEIMFGLAERTNNPQLAIIHYGIAWQLAQR